MQAYDLSGSYWWPVILCSSSRIIGIGVRICRGTRKKVHLVRVNRFRFDLFRAPMPEVKIVSMIFTALSGFCRSRLRRKLLICHRTPVVQGDDRSTFLRFIDLGSTTRPLPSIAEFSSSARSGPGRSHSVARTTSARLPACRRTCALQPKRAGQRING